MPRVNAIILEKDRNDPQVYRFALWADVPVARRPFYASSGALSSWTGATAGDLANLVSGSVTEKVETLRVQEGVTLGQARTLIQAAWADFQAAVTTQNPWSRYGTTWDGTTWTVGGVA
jgi:hypothetical protein